MKKGSRKPVAEKLKNFTSVTESGCWVWLGSTDKNGYGTIGRVGGAHLKAHRESYRYHTGEIPAGFHVLHRCDVTCCINPAHLYVGTHQQNMKDLSDRHERIITPEQRGALSKRNLASPQPQDLLTGRFI